MPEANAYRIAPRGLKREQAAEYLGLSPGSFDSSRRRGLLPGPTLPGKRYDRVLLDRAMDQLSGIGATVSPLDEWKSRRGSG